MVKFSMIKFDTKKFYGIIVKNELLFLTRTLTSAGTSYAIYKDYTLLYTYNDDCDLDFYVVIKHICNCNDITFDSVCWFVNTLQKYVRYNHDLDSHYVFDLEKYDKIEGKYKWILLDDFNNMKIKKEFKKANVY